MSKRAEEAGGIAFLAGMPLLGYGLEETRTTVFLYESIMQLVFVYPSRRIGLVPLPNVWIHLAVALGLVLQIATVTLLPLRTLLGLVPVGTTHVVAVTLAVLLTWAIAEFAWRWGPRDSAVTP